MPEQPCAFHPERVTAVSCASCGRPICPEDMVPAPVGYQCPVCTGRAREGALGAATYRARTTVEARLGRIPLARLLRGAGATQLLIAANVAVFLAILAASPRLQPSPETLLRFGALPAPLPRDQWWRLLSAMFVHVGFLHLAFNMLALSMFGPPVEARYGRLRFLALYLASGLLGGAFSLALTSGGIRAGASGGVFGILGAWIAFFVRHRALRGAREQLRSLAFLVGINLLLGATLGGIDNMAHLGGLLGGFVVATALEQSIRLRERALRGLVGLAGYAAVVVGAVWALSAGGRFGGPAG
jgi:membrane associated rhomboid family serine protease